MASFLRRRAHNYGTPSKVLAAVLSPWVVLAFALLILAALYFFYYKPRLHYAYEPYPASPKIHLTYPWLRRRTFTKDPVAYLNHAYQFLSSPALFWTDAIPVPGSPTVTLLCDTAMVGQFLEIDDRDSLSWDAPLRSTWNHLFHSKSVMGVDPRFYKTSRYALFQAFSEDATTRNSFFGRTVQTTTQELIGQAKECELFGLISRITAQALLQIVFSHDATNNEELALLMDEAFDSLLSETRTSKTLASRIRDGMTRIIDRRLADPEQTVETDDYLQWLLYKSPEFTKPAAASPEDSGTSEMDGARNVPDISDHLLTFLLQTRMLVVVGALWGFIDEKEYGRSIKPHPLLLLRKARKEFLFGSKVIPKDSLVAVSPVMQQTFADDRSTSSVTQQSDHVDLGQLSAFNSVQDFSDVSFSGSETLLSSSGVSPLLQGTRYSSVVDLTNGEHKTPAASSHHRRDKLMDRRYPQGRLISLMIKTITQTLSDAYVLRSDAITKHKFGHAKSLWLPFPVNDIYIIATANTPKNATHVHS